jgi:hypothetical protein
MAVCPQHDRNSDGRITAAELVAAIRALLAGRPASVDGTASGSD